MLARELTPDHAGRLITWTHNDVTYQTRPYAIEQAHGFTYLHVDGWKAHELRGTWDVTVLPKGTQP